jgi:hypothetical protein
MPRIVALEHLTQFAAVELSDGGYIRGPQIIPNCAMVRLNWSLSDLKIAHNVLHVSWSGTPALSQTIANSIMGGLTSGAAATAFLAFLNPQTALQSVTLLDLRSSAGVEVPSNAAAVPGSAGGVALPDEMAVVVTLRTANRGRSGRGRIYLPGFNAGASAAGGVIAAAAVTAINNWVATNLLATLSAQLGPLVLGLPHRRAYTSPTGAAIPDRPATTVAVTTATVRNNTWDSQRRRGLK